MNSDRWSRIRRLHAEALEHPAGERRAFLERECGGDQILLEEIWELVSQDEDGGFLEAGPVEQVAPGVVLGDFELLEELGSGGTGIVFRARQKSLEREVALKIMPRHFALNERRVARFVREAKAAAKLEHPGIAPIYGVGCVNDNHFIAMELVAGHDLARELELQLDGCGLCSSIDSTSQFREAARIVMQTADALAFAHGKGVVHRDVKPNNILLDIECRPRLVDFGLAKDESLGSITVADKVEGTPYYMSPEQARLVEDKVDARTDIYSLGVVLYELLTRSRPFEGRTSQEVISKIIRREPRPVRAVAPSVPRDLAVICTKAMEKRPEDRYATAKAMRDDLESFLAGEPIRARPPGVARRLSRRVAQNRVAVTLVAGVFLTLGGGSWARVYSERQTWPELELEVLFADPAIAPGALETVVTASRIHVLTGEVLGEPQTLSAAAPFRLPPGMWLIDVAAEGMATSSLTRVIAGDQPVMPLRARLFAPGDFAFDVVRLDSFELPRFGIMGPNLEAPRSQNPTSFGGEGNLSIPALFVQATEMSFGLFRQYLRESGDPEPESWSQVAIEKADDSLPVVLVTRDEARACAEWFGMRLPFEPELEYASRGPKWNHTPSWSDDLSTAGLANTSGFEVVKGRGVAVTFETYLLNAESVSTRPEAATPTGLFHTLGNVKELTESFAPPMQASKPLAESSSVIVYGGAFAWARNGGLQPAVELFPRERGYSSAGIGFRCVRTAGPQ